MPQITNNCTLSNLRANLEDQVAQQVLLDQFFLLHLCLPVTQVDLAVLADLSRPNRLADRGRRTIQHLPVVNSIQYFSQWRNNHYVGCQT